MKKETVVKKMILSDCKELMDGFCQCDDLLRQVYMIGGLGYFALVVDGAIKWCHRAGIPLQIKSNDTLEKLRAKVKLFSGDSKISFDEQMKLYEEIIGVEKQYYLDLQARSGKYCPRFLIPDMGEFMINGHCIGNTIQFAYELSPFNPQKMPFTNAVGKKEANDYPLSYSFAYELGACMQKIIRAISGQSYVLQNCRSVDLKYSERDIRISNNRNLRRKNRAIQILNLSCRLNYILELIVPLCNQEALLPLRIAYLTYYHLQEDLHNLRISGDIHYHMPYRDNILRKAMAHYSLYGKLDETDIREDVIGFGLFERTVSADYKIVRSALLSEMKHTRDDLEKYIKV